MSIIRGRRLRISRIRSLNDPFELMPFELSDRELRAKVRRIVDGMHENRGFVSFSEQWTNPVQWAHYAENHQGVCLGFDINDEKLARIHYAADRVPVVLMEHAIEERDEQAVLRFLFTKFEHWQYEQERRIICALESADIDGHFYQSFSDDLRLREVIVGARNTTLTKRELSGALNTYRDVNYFKVRPAFRTFTMTKQLDKRLGLR